MSKRVLIVKFWALGDILMATPLIRAIKAEYPDAYIAWLADDRYSDILDGNPLLDEVIPFDSGTWRRHFRYGNVPAYLRMSLGMRRALQDRKFDVVINLTAEKWWAMWFNVAPVRIGLFPRANPGKEGRLYTTAIPRTREPWLHNTEHYLLPADALGIPGPHEKRMLVAVRDADRESARAFLKASPVYRPHLPLLLLHPGTSQETKCWPTGHFAALADRLVDRFNVVVTGSPGERTLAGQIREAAKAPDRILIAAGELPDMRQTAALVEMAAAVVTGDTSVLHMASALDTPLVGVYGSTRPRDNAPLFGRHELLFDDDLTCSPCYKSHCPLAGKAHLACLTRIAPEQVLAALEKVLPSSVEAVENVK